MARDRERDPAHGRDAGVRRRRSGHARPRSRRRRGGRSRRAPGRSCRCTSPAARATWTRSARSPTSHGLRVVEDAAHAVEADVRGRRVGAIGDFTCFSLYATKSLAGGEGGIVTTSLATPRPSGCGCCARTGSPATRGSGRGRTRSATTTSSSPGSRPTWPTCRRPRRCRSSTGWSAFHAHRTELVARYDAGLAPLAGIEPIGRPDYGRHAHHLYVVRIDPALAGADRDRYAAALMAENISTGLHFLPVHTLTWYRQQPGRAAAAGDRARRRAGALAAARGGAFRRRHRRRRRGACARCTPRSRGEDRPPHPGRGGGGGLGGGARPAAAVGGRSTRWRTRCGGTDLAWFLPAVAVSTGHGAGDGAALAAAARGQAHARCRSAGSTRTYFVALFAGQFLPAAIGGDAVRVVELGRRTDDAPEAVASVLIDRLVGLVSLVVLAIVAVARERRRAAAGRDRGRGGVRRRGRGVLAAALLEPPARRRRALARAARGGAAAGGRAALLRRAARLPRRIAARWSRSGCWRCSCRSARVGVIWMLVRALGLDVPDSVLLLAGPVVFAALALPVSLNGIGVREAVFVYFLHGHADPPGGDRARPRVLRGRHAHGAGRRRACSWCASSATASGPCDPARRSASRRGKGRLAPDRPITARG